MATKSGFDTSDFDKLARAIENLGREGRKISKQSVLEASEVVLAQQRKDAPKANSDSTKGYNHLAISKKVKTYGNGSCYAKIGMTSENWNQVKHLAFQHYGFENHGRGGRYRGMFISKHSGWVNKSFDKCKDKAYKELQSNLKNKLKLK